jgi:parallel beta-helix repeat protein
MSLPAKYPPAVTPANWNAMVDCVNGYTPSGTFISPYTYVISTDGTDYYASNAFQTIYGGPDDAGGVDGADCTAVLNAAKGSGKTLFFRANTTYPVSATFAFSNLTGFSMIGENRTAVLKLDDGVDNSLLYGKAATDIEISNLGLDGNGVNQTTWSNCIKLAALSSNIRIFNNEIYNAGTTGVEAGYSDGDISDVYIFNNIIHDCGLATAGDGIGLEAPASYYNHHFIIKNNYIYNINRYGIMLYNRSYRNTVTNNRIVNTGTTDTYGDNIRLYGANNNLVTQNILESTSAVNSAAIGLFASSHHNIIAENEIYDVTQGIKLNDSTFNKVTQNNIDTCTYGIGETNGATSNDVFENFIDNCTTTALSLTSTAVRDNVVEGVSVPLTAGVREIQVGTLDVTGATNELTIAHGLSNYSAAKSSFAVVPKQTGSGKVCVSSADATNFVITFETQPDALQWWFYWIAVTIW